LVADWAERILTMAEPRTSEAQRQAEFEAFYQRTAAKLHGYLCKLSRDPAAADEVLQEAYIRMMGVVCAEETARRAYLYRTATNLLRDRWRRQKVERDYWERETFSEAVSPKTALALDVASVFEKLSPVDRAALWLAHVEQLSHREVAKILGVKEQSIKVMLFRARGRARELFEEAGFGEQNSDELGETNGE
jgi:RNA polymerase sigma-70 factor, ECF subfamily